MSSIKVMIVEDDEFWIKNLTEDLHAELDIAVVKTVSTKEEAVAAVQQMPLDVILMDINLTENRLDGIDAIREINSIKLIDIIVLTAISKKEVIIESFKCGAVNWISKSNVQDIVQAIRGAYHRKGMLHYDCADVLRIEFVKMKMLEKLTLTEKEIYELREAGLNKYQIAEKLNKSFFTVKNQLKVIRAKLNV